MIQDPQKLNKTHLRATSGNDFSEEKLSNLQSLRQKKLLKSLLDCNSEAVPLTRLPFLLLLETQLLSRRPYGRTLDRRSPSPFVSVTASLSASSWSSKPPISRFVRGGGREKNKVLLALSGPGGLFRGEGRANMRHC